jgi:hypothetical protein
MTTREQRVLTLVGAELEDLIDAIDKHGMQYAKRYTEYLLSGRQQKRHPLRPAALRPEVAKAIREACLDSCVVAK